MRLLLDANISIRLIASLKALGHDVASMFESNPNTTDQAVLIKACEEQRVLVTYDKDFGELAIKQEQKHYGIILLRTRDESYLTQQKILKKFIQSYTEIEIQKYFWVVDESTVRKTN